MIEKMGHICQYHYHKMLQNPNVIGIGVGIKKIRGIETNRPCLTVYVIKKLPKQNLDPCLIIPSTYMGFETDVVESGIPRLIDNCLQDYNRPVIGGYQISTVGSGGYGTACCLVADKSDVNYILSCNHVLLKNDPSFIGKSVSQPMSDVSIFYFGEVSKNYTPLVRPGDNKVDAALVQVSPTTIGKLAWPYVEFLGQIKGVKDPTLNLPVKMAGATSGVLEGKVTAIHATYQARFDNYLYTFVDQVDTDMSAMSGDSGSLIMSSDDNYAVGMVIAAKYQATSGCTMNNILDALKVDMVYSIPPFII